jgi:small redox-active disulfide protein 2
MLRSVFIMKQIKVLGSGCRNCEITANVISQAAKDAGVEVEIEKVTDIAAIMAYGVMSTPGVVVDGKVVHAGGIPGPDQVRAWVEK